MSKPTEADKALAVKILNMRKVDMIDILKRNLCEHEVRGNICKSAAKEVAKHREGAIAQFTETNLALAKKRDALQAQVDELVGVLIRIRDGVCCDNAAVRDNLNEYINKHKESKNDE